MNVVVFTLIAYSYSLTLSSNLTLTDYSGQLIGSIGIEIRIIFLLLSLFIS